MIKVKTDAKKIQFIANCILCDKKIYNDERWCVLHGVYFCQDEELTKLVFQYENFLLSTGKIRLKFGSPSVKSSQPQA